jgi:integrase
VPAMGRLRLRDVRPTHVEAMLRDLSRSCDGERTLSGSSVRRVHATLRSALGSAKRRRLISVNPAADVDLPKASRPRVHPWEPSELGQFLDHIGSDELGVLFEVVAMTGLRRGEAVGLRWSDVDLERSRLVVGQQISRVGSQVIIGKPKTASGEDRVVDLDERTVGALLAHRLRQDADRARAGSAWVDTGLVFTRADGTAWHPEMVTARFKALAAAAGLRGIRLHDLRHGQASLMLAAGVPIATVSKRLGHSSISITADTYSHLLEGVGLAAAEAAASLVPRGAIRSQSVPNRAPEGRKVPAAEGIAAGHDLDPVGRAGLEPATCRIMSPPL